VLGEGGVGVCAGGVRLVVSLEGSTKDGEVKDCVVVIIEEGVGFEGVKEEEVFCSCAKSGVVVLEICNGCEFDEEGCFEVCEVGSGEGVNVIQVVQVVHDKVGSHIKRTKVERMDDVRFEILTN
jgi:hypothetical protein